MDYQLEKLWPDFSRILELDFQTPEGLSAMVVAVLLFLALVFVLWATTGYFRANERLRFYRSLINGMSAEELLEKRRDIVNLAFEKSENYGKLWREFDESLVNIQAKQRLCNTLDSAHFFNTHSLARGLTENRLLAAVPGFLTAIGVLGTFAGLELGLSGLDLSPEENDVESLKAGINTLIGGASIAFMTSVWGVLTSVLFNFYEKMLERGIRNSISSFQNEVDYLYPRITAEQSLSNIEDFSRQSMEKLAELDEKIGHKMQEAMREASGIISQSMTDSLEKILGPAIDKLVNDAHSGSEKALESLLNRFLDGVGQAGEDQKALMEKATLDMSAASGDMTRGLNEFTGRLDAHLESFMEKQRDTVEQLEQQLRFRQEEQAELENARQAHLNAQVTAMQGSQSALTGSVEKLLGQQSQQNDDLHLRLGELLQSMRDVTAAQREVAGSIQNSSSNIDSAANQMGILSTNLREAAEAIGTRLQDAVTLIARISQEQQNSVSQFLSLINEMEQIREKMLSTSQTLNSAAEKADHGMQSIGQHFDALGETLNKHVESLQQQTTDLLTEYANRVNEQTMDRMNTWNEQTSEYISQMTSAVQVLNGIVDDIETKLGN